MNSKKLFDTFLKVILSLLLLTPILGVLGIFPEPTADLYNTPQAFEFIKTLAATKYIPVLIALVFALALVLIWTNRMGIVALLILPIVINIMGFHMFLDGGLFTAGAVMANVLFLIDVYFLWQNRDEYLLLWKSE